MENKREDALFADFKNNRALLKAVIDSAPEGIVVTDEQAHIILTNKAADELYARPVPYNKVNSTLNVAGFAYLNEHTHGVSG